MYDTSPFAAVSLVNGQTSWSFRRAESSVSDFGGAWLMLSHFKIAP